MRHCVLPRAQHVSYYLDVREGAWAPTPSAGGFVIDQSVHTQPTGLKPSPDQDLEAPPRPETGTGRKRSKVTWAFGIVALVLAGTFVLHGTPPENISQTPAKAQAAPVPVTATEVSTRDVLTVRKVSQWHFAKGATIRS
jgi:hypothetical protein